MWALFQLLTVNPRHRVSSLQDMKETPSLANVLWDDLSKKKVEPGFVPNVSCTTVRQTGVPGWLVAPVGEPGALSLRRKAACTATPPSSWKR